MDHNCGAATVKTCSTSRVPPAASDCRVSRSSDLAFFESNRRMRTVTSWADCARFSMRTATFTEAVSLETSGVVTHVPHRGERLPGVARAGTGVLRIQRPNPDGYVLGRLRAVLHAHRHLHRGGAHGEPRAVG